ncbi:hypothetical protein KC332_g15834 [Hortaea werneckii]|uniref:Heterokaryon incompatibility domain-containing protein n=2 Tax=Hortaea werneckii TaxID=91943 RepID=A0A3M7I5Q1_HORWE|nr:hypothetical protein KC329_g15958 [Hortaea werneckii]KAI7274636.1 hypothetical protein KC335_g2281 [Hortaea werneckii]KAI7384714.1 hypothetical protein KC332_g15834 [Hortaea werneckii]KAI7403991.1 hypothetical protein KC336_g14142 [Hortaea werneckii]KAI7432736.1 hypothetical protein KC368_g15420 [Hortaea werneckii]
MEEYQYSPLLDNANNKSFRLLSLLPGDDKAPLGCRIQTFSLDHAPPYEALSYVWGQRDGCRALTCNSGFLHIKHNLEQALFALRHPDRPRFLWVDAVCINQKDYDERAQQVRIMREIYARAERVVVWLGPRSRNVDYALHLAKRLDHMSTLLEPSPEDHFASFWDQSVVKALAAEERAGRVPETLFAATEIADLFDRDWFSRIWCVQEVFASKEAVIRIEDIEAPFSELVSVAQYALLIRERYLPSQPLEFWGVVANHKYGGRPFSSIEGSVGNLERVLISTRNFHATDPRDKIFALMGFADESKGAVGAYTPPASNSDATGTILIRSLVGFIASQVPGEPQQPRLLKIDYHKGLMEVYRDTTRLLLRKAPRVADVLGQVQHTEETISNSYWPSWVPDWSRPKTTSFPAAMPLFTTDSKWLLQTDKRMSPAEPYKLYVEGYCLDHIVKISDRIEVDCNERLELEFLWSQLFDCPMLEGYRIGYLYGEPLLQAFLAVLIMGELGCVLYDGFINLEALPSKRSHPKLQRLYQRAMCDGAAFVLRSLGLDYQDRSVETPGMSDLRQQARCGVAAHYERAAKTGSFGRRLFLTAAGRIGLGPMVCKPGDVVSVIYGGRMPFILPPTANDYRLIGDAYIRDAELMWGGISEKVRKGRGPVRQQTLEIR